MSDSSLLTRGRLWGLLAALAAAVVGCTAHAATEPTERVVPLPLGSFYVAALDADRFAALVQRRGQKAVVFLHRATGAVDGGFDVPSDSIALAPLDQDGILVLGSSKNAGVLGKYSMGGARVASLALKGSSLGLASLTGGRTFVLAAAAGKRAVVEVDPLHMRTVNSLPAPPGAESIGVRFEDGEPAFVTGDSAGKLYEHTLDDKDWTVLSGSGFDPIFADSGHAIYTLQRFDHDAYVSVVSRPSGLPVRMFPVARRTAQLATGLDGWLVVLERVGSSSAMREIGCRSPLLETRAYTDKHAAYYFDEGNRAQAPGMERSTSPPVLQTEPC